MVSVGGQGAQDRLLHLCGLPEVAVLHGTARRPARFPPILTLKLRCSLTHCVVQKEFGIAQASNKLLVVACEPLSKIRAVDPSAYPQASNVLAYLMNGGQVIFHGEEDVVAEIRKFLA